MCMSQVSGRQSSSSFPCYVVFSSHWVFTAQRDRLGSSLFLIWGALLVILLEHPFWEQVALPVEKEIVWFLLVPESLITPLEVMLTWMVGYLEATLTVQTAFLVLFLLWTRWSPPLLPLLDLFCCVCSLENTLLITVVALVQALRLQLGF